MDYSISRDSDDSPSGAARKAALRQTLMAARHSASHAADHATNAAADNALTATAACLLERLGACLEHLSPRCVAFYWPINDEVDLRDAIVQWLARQTPHRTQQNAQHVAQQSALIQRMAALPVVSGKHMPMTFHRWHADMPMQEGAFRIPVPAASEVVTPDLLLVPCVGFDARCYRLGYGGGFYDRTLAAMSPRPATLGIALSCTGVDALPIEAHDIPLDGILTEDRALGSIATVF